MTIDLDKLKERVHKMQDEYERGKITQYEQGAIDALYNLMLNLRELEPSLPPDVDKAAEEYAYTNWEDDDYHEGAAEGLPFDPIGFTEKVFKAGVSYEAGKGETLIAKVKINGMGRAYLALENVYLNSGYGYKEGDRVIVQIKPKV